MITQPVVAAQISKLFQFQLPLSPALILLLCRLLLIELNPSQFLPLSTVNLLQFPAQSPFAGLDNSVMIAGKKEMRRVQQKGEYDRIGPQSVEDSCRAKAADASSLMMLMARGHVFCSSTRDGQGDIRRLSAE